MALSFRSFELGDFATNAYVVWQEGGPADACWVIDRCGLPKVWQPVRFATNDASSSQVTALMLIRGLALVIVEPCMANSSQPLQSRCSESSSRPDRKLCPFFRIFRPGEDLVAPARIRS
jgi:hypothetical protein